MTTRRTNKLRPTPCTLFAAVAIGVSAMWAAPALGQSVIDMPAPRASQTAFNAEESPRQVAEAGRLAMTRFARGRSGPKNTYGMYDRTYRYGSYGFRYAGYGVYPWGYNPWFGCSFPHAHIRHVGGGRFVGHLHH